MSTMLTIKDLRAYYGQIQALHGLEFSLNEGSVTTLLGAGADPSIADKNGVTALEHARDKGFDEIAEVLAAGS